MQAALRAQLFQQAKRMELAVVLGGVLTHRERKVNILPRGSQAHQICLRVVEPHSKEHLVHVAISLRFTTRSFVTSLSYSLRVLI